MKIKNLKLTLQLSSIALFFSISTFTLTALSQPSTTKFHPVSLAHAPLHSSSTLDKPTITLALSVEFPTIGALYRKGTSSIDDSYSSSTEYIGYFYSKGCYEYLKSPTDTPSTGESQDDYKRFRFVSESASRTCSDEHFSGNFLNWASSSSIDILRLALSGGDRYIDKDGLTVLQRAVVPAGTPKVACLWNHEQFFPAKKLEKNKFAGAIPSSLASKADNNDLWISSKHNGIYFNTTAPKNRKWDDPCDIDSEVDAAKKFLSTLNSDGFYYARVEVCTKSPNGTVADHRDFGLCTQQANGNFKPTGVIQKHANNLRIAAFGYTLDHSSGRYGGVLRAPMRYVGSKQFDIYGREKATTNPYAEWDPYTGILHTNPYGSLDNSLASWPSGKKNSGVINYLNKFGRLGTVIATKPTTDDDSNHYYGEYKKNDPISSLYHQSLRYLQGLPNITEASNNLINKYYDGFPIYTDWSTLDPFGNGRSSAENYACLKNNIVAIGDIYSQENNGWKTVNSDDESRQKIDFSAWRKKALDYEKDNFSNTLNAEDKHKIIGYAYWAHANDIRGKDWTENSSKQRPGLRIKTFIFDVNEKGDSSDLSKRRKTNQFYLAAKYGGYETDPNNKDGNYYSVDDKPNKGYSPKDKGDPKTLLTKNAIWERRPVNERDNTTNIYDASTYYLQSDARSVLKAFDEIFDRAASSAQSISQSASSTSSISATTDSHIYTGTYDMASWTGNIVAKRITVDTTTKEVTLVEDTTFDPAAKLNLRTSTSRNIVIGLGKTDGAANFQWNELKGTAVATHLSKASPSATSDNLGELRVNYLRGDRSLEGRTVEGNEFRTRLNLLGDIINAGVTYSGSPTNKFTNKSYQLFLEATKNRLPIVITGANDGMLHAFAAKTSGAITAGDEVFAYIPSWLAPKLPSLTTPDYVNNHQAFVDAPSAVGEAQLSFTSGNGSASDWKTVLVSGTGAGGRGVFALDITDPTQFSSNHVLWEFTNADDSDMGYVVSKPKILQFKTGVNTYRWFAVVASGVNNYDSTYESGTGTGTPSIFLLALDKPKDTAWSLGSNYFKISFPLDNTLAATMAPGIVDFSTLWSADGSVTHIYAGDLHGNLWKLDFTSSTETSKFKPVADWTMEKLSAFKQGRPEQVLPLYRAERTSNNTTVRQPISAAPLLVQGPIVQGVETFYVLFGTGKYLEASDVSDASKQSFYALFDNGTTITDNTAAITPGRSRLQQATVNTTTQTISIPSFTWGRPSSDEQAQTVKAGWYYDFPENAERMIYAASDLGNFKVTFNSVVPGEAQLSPSICSTDMATSNVYDLDIRSGGGSYRVSQIGILGPSLFLHNEEKTVTSKVDSTGRAQRTIVREEVASGTKGHAVRNASLVETVGRLSWRQIYNYKELRHKALSATSTTSPPTETAKP